jgi:hypothetical protein
MSPVFSLEPVMTKSRLRRFAEVRLGDAIDGGPVGEGSWEEHARRLVIGWSGSDRAGLTHVEAPSPAARPRDIAGRIFARHLGDSRCVDIEVIGRDRGQVCATAVVRVALG